MPIRFAILGLCALALCGCNQDSRKHYKNTTLGEESSDLREYPRSDVRQLVQSIQPEDVVRMEINGPDYERYTPEDAIKITDRHLNDEILYGLKNAEVIGIDRETVGLGANDTIQIYTRTSIRRKDAPITFHFCPHFARDTYGDKFYHALKEIKVATAPKYLAEPTSKGNKQ